MRRYPHASRQSSVVLQVEQPAAFPPLARARAAARLRARDVLAESERRAVRDARGELGGALRRARRRGATEPDGPLNAPPFLLASGRRDPRRIAAAAALALSAVALLLLTTRAPAVEEAGGGAPLAAPEAALVVRESATSRGRSHAAVAFVAAEPTAEPAVPTPAPIAAPAAPVVRTGTLPGTGGTGTGPGGASGAGRGPSPAPVAPPAPTASPTPAPTPVPTVAPRSADVTRFTGRVVDSRTGRVIAGVCVIVGVRQCDARDVYTDATGRFAIDLAVGNTWDVNFGRAGYTSGYRRLVSSSPRTLDIGTIRLSPVP